MEPSHYSHFTNPLARDLAWLLDKTHDLPVDLAPFHSIRTLPLPTLSADAIYNEVVTAAHEDKNLHDFSRLGKSFENLVELWLRAVTTPGSAVERNIRIQDMSSGATLGELDFTFDDDGLRHHLEVAVKFYAGVEHASQWQWLGEDPRDSLAAKCQHLRDRQLPRSLALPDVTGQRVYWLKGGLFQPLKDVGPNLIKDELLTLVRVRGGWCHTQQLSQAALRWPGHYAALPYERWLGGLELNEARRHAQPLEDWGSALGSLKRSLMLTSVETDIADRWRIWIMPDHWPSINSCVQPFRRVPLPRPAPV